MKVDLEEVKENSKYKSSWKSNKESKQRKRQIWEVECFQSINNFSRGQGQGKGGGEALTTQAYSLTHPKARLYLSQHGGGGTNT